MLKTLEKRDPIFKLNIWVQIALKIRATFFHDFSYSSSDSLKEAERLREAANWQEVATTGVGAVDADVRSSDDNGNYIFFFKNAIRAVVPVRLACWIIDWSSKFCSKQPSYGRNPFSDLVRRSFAIAQDVRRVASTAAKSLPFSHKEGWQLEAKKTSKISLHQKCIKNYSWWSHENFKLV